MSLLRLILLAGIVILIGACGNDEDIETTVDETAATPEYVMPEGETMTDPVLEQETAPSRDPAEEVIPTPETDTELDPAGSETTSPDSDPVTEPETTPEGGMPQ